MQLTGKFVKTIAVFKHRWSFSERNFSDIRGENRNEFRARSNFSQQRQLRFSVIQMQLLHYKHGIIGAFVEVCDWKRIVKKQFLSVSYYYFAGCFLGMQKHFFLIR